MEIINGERLVLGTCYYPEHWDESLGGMICEECWKTVLR